MMREQDDAAGFPSLALPYGVDRRAGKLARLPWERNERGPDLLAPRPLQHAVMDGLKIAPAFHADLLLARMMHDSDLATEIVASGRFGEEEIAETVAQFLGISRGRIDPRHCRIAVARGRSDRFLRTIGPGLRPLVFMAPRLEDLDRIDAFFARHPALRDAVRITTPTDLRLSHERASESDRSEAARHSLSSDRPIHSARHTVSGGQGFVFGVALAAWLFAPAFLPGAPLLVHAFALPAYLACTGLRIAAAVDLVRARRRTGGPPAPRPPRGEGAFPRYSILVALRNEPEECVAALVDALLALKWPVSRRQVLLVCEADDPATAESCERAICGLPGFSVVRVPPSFPRTKPKALNFALPLASGDLVVLFDAEDRPHPQQLVAAWQAFRDGGPELACVQAPLVVSNASRNWLTQHFAMEYAALFKGLLPWLAARRMPLPLGGTSNHFRRAALVEVGAWDSHNVAEDADLGIRLARHGYRTGVISPPTFEDAPERWIDWRNQRTRWMKGWCQSWLVHMRRPGRLLRELGFGNFVVFQLLFAGMIGCGVAHAVLLAVALDCALSLILEGWPAGLEGWVLALDCAVLAIGYGAYSVLALLCHRDGPGTARAIWSLPAYWTLIGLATLRALWQLRDNPQLWEKTPHGRASRRLATGPSIKG